MLAKTRPGRPTRKGGQFDCPIKIFIKVCLRNSLCHSLTSKTTSFQVPWSLLYCSQWAFFTTHYHSISCHLAVSSQESAPPHPSGAFPIPTNLRQNVPNYLLYQHNIGQKHRIPHSASSYKVPSTPRHWKAEHIHRKHCETHGSLLGCLF